MNSIRLSAQASPTAEQAGTVTHAHVVNSFRFEIGAPMARVAPLFAPIAERSWAGPQWDPIFLYPQPGRDMQGAVWTIKHGPHKSIWINTLFDVADGKIQYVAVIGDQVITTVDVQVKAATASRTAVEVTYIRTALDPGVNDAVRAMGENDSASGPEWQHSIESVLGLTHEPTK